MRSVGNILIIIGQLIWLSVPLSLAIGLVLSFIFGCTGGFTTSVYCTRAGSTIEDIATFFAGWFGISAFVIIPITAPLFGIGFLIRNITSRKIVDPDPSSLDLVVSSLGRYLLISFKIFLACAFWWLTIAIFCYQTLKLRSVSLAYEAIRNFIFK